MKTLAITDPGWNTLFLVAGWTLFGFFVLFLFIMLVWLLGKLTPERPDTTQSTLSSLGETPVFKSITKTTTYVPSEKPKE